MDKDKFESDMKESRDRHYQFHWYIIGFSGAVLTALFNFIKDVSPIQDSLSICYFKISIWSLVFIIVFAAFRNYSSTIITSLYAHSVKDWNDNKLEAIKAYNKAALLTRLRLFASYMSIGLCFVVLVLLSLAINRIYL
jgi:hypothetical protein